MKHMQPPVVVKRYLALELSVLALAPLLAAPLCQSVHPNWPTNPPPSSNFRTNQQSVEPKLVEANADSVLVLGISDWAAVEPCNACFFTSCSATPWPSGWPNDVSGRHEELDLSGTQKYRCNFNFSNVDAYLDTHADPFGARTVRRHFMVQLAPVFYVNRRTPAYLNAYKFNSAVMESKYHRLWNNALPVVAQHVASPGDPWVAIAVGNEVNAYLNSQSNPAAAWDEYSQFVADAVAYINASNTYTLETVSTQCYGFCGLCDPQPAPSCLADAQTRALNLMHQTDVNTITYYPPTNLNTTDLGSRINSDFSGMYALTQAGFGSWLIQETGYPTGGSPPPGSNQTSFVNALFASYGTFNSAVLGVSYFALTDFPSNVFIPTGFYRSDGTVKSATAWSNFKAKMAAVPP